VEAVVLPIASTLRMGRARWRPYWWLLRSFVAKAQPARMVMLVLDRRTPRARRGRRATKGHRVVQVGAYP